uniref:Pentatricopeptide repeat-containing protein At1g80880, mitochondrial n=2 Tax=Elaeis guineensis var. tenera TaxID=51953 RepID=A0A6I9QMI0_ELAGV|nr:pentatricopeptide repeat-containing protein At1g80880, mitochondrial [Elaeis guineensis]
MVPVVTVTRRKTRLPLLLLRSVLLNPAPRPCGPFPPRSPAPSAFSFSSLASPSCRLPPFGAQPQSPILSSLRPSPDTNSSDFESDSDQPKTPVDESDLQGFFQLLSQAKSLSSSPKEALAFLRASSGVKITRDLVCKALWELRWDWESALLALRWAEEHVLGCPWAWHLMLWVLGKQGRFDLAWWLVRRLYRKSILTQRAMVIMMERYAAANDARKAIKTFHAMETFRIDADLAAYYALLCALCKNKNVEEAEEFLLLNRKFYPLTADNFNVVLDGWCNIIGDVAEAKRVWREMSNCCITPNGTTYSHMICCFSKVGNLFDCLRLYDEMKKRGWVPDLLVYNSLIYVLTKENCLKDANNIFERITEAGLQPNVETYNSMIYPLCEAHKLEEARVILDEMMVKGFHPNIDTYHAFIKAEDVEGTLKVMNKMRIVGCGPNGYTFLLLFDKFFSLDKSDGALRMWSEMKRYNVVPGSAHYMALVQGLALHGWIPKALEFYNEMISRGFPADPKLEKLFKTFMSKNKNHWSRGGKEYIVSRHGRFNSMAGAKIR